MKKTERKKESAQTMEEQAAVGKINGLGVRMALSYAFPKTVPIMVCQCWENIRMSAKT